MFELTGLHLARSNLCSIPVPFSLTFAAVTRSATKFIDCATEPIRTPGSIQPHGRLLVLDAATRELLSLSANWPPGTAQRTAALIDPHRLQTLPEGGAAVSVGLFDLDGVPHEAFAHRTPTQWLVEFELAGQAPEAEAPIYQLTRSLLPRLQATASVSALATLAVEEMKRLTGFGRCLLYRFSATGNGEVLAEDIDPGYESYAGHFFPAADIPAQARALYVANHFRLIPDAGYTPVPIVPASASRPAVPDDLGQAQLRSVSPIHLEYMRNMGTLASMSVSIVIDGRLWGLISCHHQSPRNLPVAVRRAAEHLGELLALQIRSSELAGSAAKSLALRKCTLDLVAHLSESDATLQQLVGEPALLLGLARAQGAAVLRDDRLWTTGDVPSDADIRALGEWIAGMGVTIYHDDAVASHFDAGGAGVHAAGVLAISISQFHQHLILWFRPERVQSITWAGDPRKAAPSPDGRIHPRASFSSWIEEVRGRSLPWSEEEIGAAGELRQALIAIVLRRAEEVAAIATELGRVNKELEAFSYTVSHDLRAPMRHIAGYVDLVMGTDGSTLSERARKYLGHVKDASVFAGQLVDALLDFSRMSRSALKRKAVNCETLVDALVRELRRQEPAGAVEWEIVRPLPVLEADPVLLQVAVRNLLSNAVKYSRDRQPARIRVRPVVRPEGEGLEVEDNGVGFQMRYIDKLFGVFQRLHSAEEFEGTGIGLANVKRIVERHGGQVYAFGEVGRGARFGFTLPLASAQPDAPPNGTSHA